MATPTQRPASRLAYAASAALLAASLVLTFMGNLTWGTWLVLLLATGAAEVIEFVALKKVGERYGASRKAFWGAIIGGFLGLFVGVPQSEGPLRGRKQL